MKRIEFSKMHGLGNDFVVIDGISQEVSFSENDIKNISHRYIGVGCDQVLLIRKSEVADFSCVIFNADGSEAEQCGNGMRAVARFLHENKLIHKNAFTIQTKAGIIPVLIHDYDSIEVKMGTPVLDPEITTLQIDNDITVEVTALSMGNPHVILEVESLRHIPVAKLGEKISTHELFPQGTNVGFMEIVNSRMIHLRTFERGVGETFACGSNACAAAVTGILQHGLDREVKVALPLGELTVRWPSNEESVTLIGPASFVFLGRYN